MLISKSIIEEFEYNIICDSTLFYFSTIYFTNYSLWAKRLLYTFLGSIFAVYYVALSPVRILTGLCFVGTPPPLSGGFRLGYFHAFRVRPVPTSTVHPWKITHQCKISKWTFVIIWIILCYIFKSLSMSELLVNLSKNVSPTFPTSRFMEHMTHHWKAVVI